MVRILMLQFVRRFSQLQFKSEDSLCRVFRPIVLLVFKFQCSLGKINLLVNVCDKVSVSKEPGKFQMLLERNVIGKNSHK